MSEAIKLWDVVHLVTDGDESLFQVVGEIKRGKDDVKLIITDSDVELHKYPQELKIAAKTTKKKAGF